MARRFAVIGALLAAYAVVLAPPPLAAAAPTAAAPGDRTVTPKNDGQTITIARHGKLTISLKDNNPSTGYSWQFRTKPSTAILKLLSDKTATPTPTVPPTVGAPEPRTIVYEGLKVGRTKIKLAYVGPSGTTAKTLAITVKVVKAAAPAAPSSRTVTPKNDGQTIRIATHGKLTISLKDNNPSTGYSWQFKTKPSRAILKLVSDKTVTPTPTIPPTVGAPEPRTIVYTALKAGTTKIKLAYVGPSGTTAQTLAITVKVR